MLINADFSRRAVVAPDQYRWVSSPESGVERVMLDRVGAEKARATSLVRYAPGSRFPVHAHPGGEEILVLSGTFSADQDHAPAGWYLRNPPGSSHRPFSDEGALIFVKLWQMPPEERRTVRTDTGDPAGWVRRDDHEALPLFTSDHERVELRRLTPQGGLTLAPEGGAELLVLAGNLTLDGASYPRGTWIRLPPGDTPGLLAGPNGVTVYLKSGHLSADALRASSWPTQS